MTKLPRLLTNSGDPLHGTAYLLKVLDKEEKEKYTFIGDSGEEHTLYIPVESINNTTVSFPTTGVVVEAFGDSPDFSPGDLVVCEQNVFRAPDRTHRKWDVLYETEEHGELFRAFNLDVFARINQDGTLTPRKGVVICENVMKENYSTTLAIELPDSAKTRRRDLVRARVVWSGGEDIYHPGDYLLIQRSADWRFKHKGEELIIIDHLFDDVIAIVGDDKWENPNTDHTIY